MSVQTSPLAHAYHQRRGSFVSDERFGDWRLKLYGLARRRRACGRSCSTATRELAARSLPAVDERRYGAAFAIAHDARVPDLADLLVAGRERAPLLHLRRGAPRQLELLDATAFGCVWELGIVEFERRAWIADVIGNPDGPDLDAYLSRRFDGMI